MPQKPITTSDQVEYVSGASRVFGIIGHPIVQVRSPEMVTAEITSRGHNGILIPMHILPENFDTTVPELMKMPNLDGLIFTIPYKAKALALANSIGANAKIVGSINALTRDGTNGWKGEAFDGLGCVEAFRRHNISFKGKRVMLIGAGGAGGAIGVAIAHEHPVFMRIFDLDTARAQDLADKITRIDPKIQIVLGAPSIENCDILLNASPVGMLENSRLSIQVESLPKDLIVFDAIVMPETTPLLALAEACGCKTIRGREMMRGQIARIVDYFGIPRA